MYVSTSIASYIVVDNYVETSGVMMEMERGSTRPNPRLVDTRTRKVHCLDEGRHVIGETCRSSAIAPGHKPKESIRVPC